jgi:hypothetical protein
MVLGLALEMPSAAAASACSAPAFKQNRSDVTAQLSMAAPGVSVSRITDSNGNWVSYYDIPLFSEPAGRIFYNRNHGNQKIMANLDGSNAQTIASDPDFRDTHTRPIFVSFDGKLAYYVKTNPSRQDVDLYGVHVTDAGPCKEVRLTRLNMDPERPVQLSTTSYDSAKGKNVIAFANNNVLHRVLEDGTMLPDVNLPDEQNGQDFHRVRLDPKFPNIIFYRRNAPGSHDNTESLYIVDLNDPKKAYDLAQSFRKIIHPLWSPDGTQLGFKAEDQQWHVLDVARPDGSLNLDHGRFHDRAIGPKSRGELDVQFCNWSPDGSRYVCITHETGAESKIFLMSGDGRKLRPLASTDTQEKGGERTQGDTWAQFLGDNRHIIFHSARTGKLEVYLATCDACESF